MKILYFLLLWFAPLSIFCQYLETFSIADRGVLACPCSTGNATTCTSSNFSGVLWSMTSTAPATPANCAAGDHFKTISGQLVANDIDDEFCIYTPILNIAVPATSSISIPVTFNNYDNDDWINVEYKIDAGAWTQIPNQIGGGNKTIRYTGAGNTTAITHTITQGGLVGAAMTIRVCVDINQLTETTFIDQISVPETGTIVLPVTWGLVKARKKDSANEVFWSTHTEINNDHFDVERSIGNEEDFEYLASVKGKGNTTISSEYSYIDNTVNTRSTDVHYRIKQIDYDGKYDYSPVVSVRSKKETKEMATPNPFQNELTVYSNEIDLLQTSTSIVDIQGHLIKDIKIIDEDEDSKTIDTADFLPGVYLIKFPSGKVTRVVKL